MAKSGYKLDAVGWGFWVIVFIIVVGPCIYGLLQIGDQGVEPLVLVVFGTLAAAIVAGLFSWLANFLLQARAARMRAAQQHARRKERNKK